MRHPTFKEVFNRYVERALSHPKGKADKIIVTIEEIKRKPLEIASLPVSTLVCNTPSEAEHQIRLILFSLGISKKAVDAAFTAIRNRRDAGRNNHHLSKGHPA